MRSPAWVGTVERYVQAVGKSPERLTALHFAEQLPQLLVEVGRVVGDLRPLRAAPKGRHRARLHGCVGRQYRARHAMPAVQPAYVPLACVAGVYRPARLAARRLPLTVLEGDADDLANGGEEVAA